MLTRNRELAQAQLLAIYYVILSCWRNGFTLCATPQNVASAKGMDPKAFLDVISLKDGRAISILGSKFEFCWPVTVVVIVFCVAVVVVVVTIVVVVITIIVVVVVVVAAIAITRGP